MVYIALVETAISLFMIACFRNNEAFNAWNTNNRHWCIKLQELMIAEMKFFVLYVEGHQY